MYSTVGGKMKTAKGMYREGVQVDYLGGTRVKFTCPKGHEEIKDFSKGPVSKRISETAVKMFIPYWKDRISITCKKCQKERGMIHGKRIEDF